MTIAECLPRSEAQPVETQILPPPPGLQKPQIGVSVDADGIARLVTPGTNAMPSIGQDPSNQPGKTYEASREESCKVEQPDSGKCICHPAEGVPLAARMSSLIQRSQTIVVHVMGDCSESMPLEITQGEVQLHGASVDSKSGKPRLVLPAVKVKKGSLRLDNLELYSSEIQVEAGSLDCTNCKITSTVGCGVLCLQRARVLLSDCEISRCMRSGIGVNGRNVELHVTRCVVSHNNYSGIGVNHQAKAIALKENSIINNGYHGVWLNDGVVARWFGGEIVGNRLTDKEGRGTLLGYVCNKEMEHNTSQTASSSA